MIFAMIRYGFALVMVASLVTFVAAQPATPRKNVPKLCIALQNDYAPKTDPEHSDPKDFFTFPFDLSLQDAPVADVDYSPDGKYLAFCMGWYDRGGWLVVWDIEQSKEKFAVWLPLGTRDLEYSPDGKQIAIASFDQCAKVFDAETGKRIGVLPVSGTNGTNSVAYSPDGRTIATGGLHKFVILWDSSTFKERRRLEGHKVRIYCASFSHNGRMLASVDRNGIGILWNLASGQPIAEFKGHQGGIEGVTFTRDEKYVVTAGWDGSVRYWDVKSGEENSSLRRSQGNAMCVATSHDGKWVANGGYGDVVELFDHQQEESREFPHGCEAQLYGICFSPDDEEFATASFDGTVKRWSTDKLTEIQTIKMSHRLSVDPKSPVISAAWSDDGQSIYSGHDDGTLRIRDAITGQVENIVAAHKSTVATISVSPDGKSLVTGGCDNKVCVWDRKHLTGHEKDGEPVKPKLVMDEHSGWVVSSSFSPDGNLLATGSADKTIRVWNFGKRESQKVLDRHTDIVRSLHFSPDGKWLGSGSHGGEVYRWSTESWDAHQVMKNNGFRSIRFSPSGDRLAIGLASGGISIRKTDTWQELIRMKNTFGLTTLEWSPHGQWIVFGNLKGKVQLRNPKTGALIKSFGQHRAAVATISYAPSGNAFVSAGVDTRLLRRNALLPRESK